MTAKPSAFPVVAPTSSVPTAAPSMTGLVASFTLSQTVTSSVSDAEVLELSGVIAANFNVTEDDVEIEGTNLWTCYFF